MSVIRKLDEVENFLCCEQNDVCENEVTHSVCDDNGSNKKYFCCEHVEHIREELFGK